MLHRHLGVRFVYKEIEKRGREAEREPEISDLPLQLARLPAELLAELEQAAVRTNMTLINTLIDEVRMHDAALADALASLAYNFAYDKILAAVRQAGA